MPAPSATDPALPVWPIHTDYSVHTEVLEHRHVCPVCSVAFECADPWRGEPCQTVEYFEHDWHPHDGELASPADLAALTAELHRISPRYRAQAVEAVPTGTGVPPTRTVFDPQVRAAARLLAGRTAG
jgi:hypothetical protein